MMRVLAALIAGILFGIGLVISRMTDPSVVLGFLDVFGDFDPTLALVLAGAVGTTAITFRLVLRREQPILADDFNLPTATQIDSSLLAGAAGGIDTALLFLPAMLATSLLHRLVFGVLAG